MREQFILDLQKIYDELQNRQQELNSYYRLLDGEHAKAEILVNSFLSQLSLPINSDTTMAALTRLINLREDALEQVLQKEGLSEDEIIAKKEKAYLFVKEMHLLRHEYLIAWIKSENLLTPFYRTLIEGVHNIGESMSRWQSAWTAHIISGINRDLLKEYDGDEKAIFKMLQDDGLLDLNPNGAVGDRCYSVLVKDEIGHYRSTAYCDAFPNEVSALVSVIEDSIEDLSIESDEVFGQKDEWIRYFVAIKKALSIKEPKKLIGHWANVDRAWMKITTPIQVGHPLEYYEDHFRKAVALEWDLRIVNPQLQSGSVTRESIKSFSAKLADEIDGDIISTMEKNTMQIDETQLYIGQPMLYYAAEFNGLFSAQVVPNDEQVSAELGKKIFAYSDFVMESQKAKPIMQLSVETMGLNFVKKRRELIETNPKLWQEIYDISTIGHEFGHILWIDGDTEMVMNSSGQFKNIEEFKATTGGLMAFFESEKDELKKHIVDDLVSRAVGLMAWREVGEVLPYYCEGLIHLDILFSSGIISYDEQIIIDYDKYDKMRDAYQKTYRFLAQNYIDKMDANFYLSKYTKKVDGVYLPIKEEILDFVEFYYGRYREIGQQVYSK
ncbi:invasion protein CiaB [Sulfurovum sp. bin170]|uniref:invasion protein CiaB n=1 Tax=Sulfurovum sp. bin170 TaxID=2695268 RepID=UPI0013DF5C4E|nr:invasion protein CiaB [Sulfurovum sp. bin170]NEW61740.1 invasion protein CiaB [Sulfurovum sp. bin170]